MECRPACLSAVSEAPNSVPRGVLGAANVGRPGPWSAGLAFWECRPLQLRGVPAHGEPDWLDTRRRSLRSWLGLPLSASCSWLRPLPLGVADAQLSCHQIALLLTKNGIIRHRAVGVETLAVGPSIDRADWDDKPQPIRRRDFASAPCLG